MQQQQTQTKNNYDFPVSLQKAFTHTGKEIPRARAVVREDTNEPIAVVSSSYKLIPHAEIMDQAYGYVKTIGKPEVKSFIQDNGARMISEFTFMDKSLAVRKNEIVGLRVYIDNNYSAKGAMKVRIGGICMWCMNGAINHRDVFDLSVRHIGNPEVNFPEPGLVLESFQNTIKGFKRLTEIDVTPEKMEEFVEEAAYGRILPRAAIKAFEPPTKSEDHTAWFLYNFFTYHVTHKSTSRTTPLGKIKRLSKVGRWFDDVFSEGSRG